MKRKKFNKKLSLKKMTVANLNTSELKQAQGGATVWGVDCFIFSLGAPGCDTVNGVTCGNVYTCEPKEICVGTIDPHETDFTCAEC